MRKALSMAILLAITGDPGTHVQGRCTVDPTAQTVEIDTAVPYERSFAAAGLRCTFEADGRAVVEVEKNGSRSRAATNGGRINIDVR